MTSDTKEEHFWEVLYSEQQKAIQLLEISNRRLIEDKNYLMDEIIRLRQKLKDSVKAYEDGDSGFFKTVDNEIFTIPIFYMHQGSD